MNSKHTSVPRRTFIAASAMAGVATLMPSAFADPVSDAQSQADSAASALSDKQAQAEAALSSLNAMQDSLDEASDKYQEALDEQNAAQQAMDEAQRQVDEATANITQMQKRLSTRVRSMYRTGSGTFLDVLTGATSCEDFATGLDLLNDMSEDDAKLVSDLKNTRVQLTAARDEYAAQEKVAQQKAEEAEEVKRQAEATVSQYQATYDSLSSEVQQLLEQKREAEEKVREAQAEAEAQRQREQAAREEQQRQRDSATTNRYVPSAPTDGNAIVARAQSCLGLPYVWGAVGPSGYDCSGLVSYCVTGRHERIGTASTFYSWPAVSNPQPGDIVACSSHHCAIYIGNNQMIEAPTFGIPVKVSALRGSKIVRYA